ncbi:hypothetical protein [Dysgonomonas sp. 25]|uniref:hypothetical protein n=1 Tax=Dysgonomonas sp. 25 TaxID=2302933 RepID=UPI0013D44363|nr:hypothetical protein [Dysgonomonas sp. 25]NDV68560.1 hypothetical protein [Dysgonomonas sp. 25]
MSNEGKTHWKRLVNLDYIGAYSLDGQDLTVEITKVEVRRVKGEGGKEEDCTVAELRGQKPFIINRTNAKTITKIYGSPYIEDWVGKKITLYPTTTKVAGEVVECLRVRPVMPKETTFDAEIEADKKQLEACQTLAELQEVYMSLKHRKDTKIVTVKDRLKEVLK